MRGGEVEEMRRMRGGEVRVVSGGEVRIGDGTSSRASKKKLS